MVDRMLHDELAIAPVTLLVQPLGQAVHDVDPLSGAKEPDEHKVQAAAPAEE